MAKKIDWKKVELVSDDGVEVPAQLEALRGPPKSARAALSFFLTELVHQDALAPGAKVVAPLLVPFANDEKCKLQGELFELLGLLACEGSANALLFATKDLPVDAAFLRAAEAVRDAAVSRATEKKTSARLGAAFLFTTLRSNRDQLLAVLRAALNAEKDATVRATQLFALAIIGRGRVKTDAPRFTAALKSKVSIERLAGVFGLARLGPLSAEVRAALSALLRSNDTARGFPWELGKVRAVARRVAAGAGEAAAWVPLLDSDLAHVAVVEVAPLLFPTRVNVKKLSDEQRAFLDRVTQDARNFGLVQDVLKRAGLPLLATDVRKVVGLSVNEPLDERFDFGGKARPFRELVALAAQKAAQRTAVAAAVTRGKSGAEVMALCQQCVRLELSFIDADGTPSWLRVAAAFLEACTDASGLLGALRTFDIYGSVQLENGDTTLVSSLRLPIALALAKRTRAGDGARFGKLTASAFDADWAAPMWRDVLLALDPRRREPLLKKALFDWTTNFFALGGAYVPVLLATPSEALTTELVYRIGKWQQSFREKHHAWEVDGVDEKRLKKLPVTDHPRAKRLASQVRQCADVLRGAKLTRAAERLEKALTAFEAITHSRTHLN
jgi:hypothetical protein